MDLMTKEESYAERRQLFKNIWETAMQIDEKDADIMNKPKVIKTLRLDEVDRCVIGKRKKERIRNLRTVCNKILDFCDRQDADDMFYEQIAEGKEPPQHKLELKPKKLRIHRGRKKIKRAKSLFAPMNNAGDRAKATTSERKDDFPKEFTKTSGNTSPMKIKRTVVMRKTIVRKRTSKIKSNPDNSAAADGPGRVSLTRRKVVRKKRSKRKKAAHTVSPPRPSGILDWPEP